MVRFTYNGKPYGIEFISSDGTYADYALIAIGHGKRRINCMRRKEYPKHGLERAAFSAYKRNQMINYKSWSESKGMTRPKMLRIASGKDAPI